MSSPVHLHRRARTAAAAVVALALPLSGLAASAASAAPAPGASSPAADRTSPLEARRVDRVPTPKLNWFPCQIGEGDCATVELPLDYDRPDGATTTLAVARVRAADPARRIGTLFINPGGPGGSAVDIALAAPAFLGQDLLDRFDVVGVDPRGIAYSDNVQCFTDPGAQQKALAGLAVPFPLGDEEEKAYVAGSVALGKACGTTGQPLAASMSTAEVARDMDVMRRAVGDDKLTYIGFSYGTQLGQVYANLFPDRVRRVVVDGVLDPIGWVGVPANQNRPSTDRIRSADGAYKALVEYLRRCDTAGGAACSFATGDPVRNFETLAQRLRTAPIEISDEFGTFTLDYATFVSIVLSALYDPAVGAPLADFITQVWLVSEPPAKVAAKQRAAALTAVRAFVDTQRERANGGRTGFDFPYDNGLEAFTAVLCSDSVNPPYANQWRPWAEKADARAPYFGRAWLWASSPCASSTWGAVDEDRYAGPFTRRTAQPVLVVGNYYDPATNYDNAVKVDGLLPNSRLVSSDSWGHTAYGTSACVSGTVERYLLGVKTPASVTRCVGDAQPFEASPGARAAAPGQARPVPVTPFVPGLTGSQG